MGKKEAIVEDYLRKRIKELGGFSRKAVYQGRKGAPDQWCFFPGGRLLLVECKAKGEVPEPLQEVEMAALRKLGFWATWTDSREGVDRILEEFLK